MSENDTTSKKLKFKKLTVKTGIRAGGDSIQPVISSPVMTWSHSNSNASNGTVTYPTKKCGSTALSTGAASTSIVVSY